MDDLSQLLADARAGSDEAFAAFVGRSQADVWRFCAHMVGPADADDATQETYLALWRSLPSFRGHASARTWMFLLARRSAQRLGRRRRSLCELDCQAPGAAPAPDPERSAELGALVAGLGEDRRAALVLTQVFGLSYAEAAQVCGCAVGTIRSRVARAREDIVASWSYDGTRRHGPQGRPSSRINPGPGPAPSAVGLSGTLGG